jgi:hypothetical protein
VCKFCSFQNQWTNCRCRCVANLRSLRYPKPEREPAMCVRALFFSKETCYETMLSLSLCFTLRNRQHNKTFLEDDMCAHLRSFSFKNTLQTRLYRCLLNPVSSGTVLKLYKKFYHVCAGCLIPNPNPDTLCRLRSSTKQDLRH